MNAKYVRRNIIRLKSLKHTLSNLFVRLEVSVFWLASSSRIRLQLLMEIKYQQLRNIFWDKWRWEIWSRRANGWKSNFSYPLSRFKSKRCPAVTLSISYLFNKAHVLNLKEWNKRKDKNAWALVGNTYLSSLRIFSMSFRSFSVSRCNEEKWCSCVQIVHSLERIKVTPVSMIIEDLVCEAVMYIQISKVCIKYPHYTICQNIAIKVYVNATLKIYSTWCTSTCQFDRGRTRSKMIARFFITS